MDFETILLQALETAANDLQNHREACHRYAAQRGSEMWRILQIKTGRFELAKELFETIQSAKK